MTLRAQDIRQGDLFAGLPGSRAHGADFAGQALELGALAVLTDAEGWKRAASTGLPGLVVRDVRTVLGPVAAAVYGQPSQTLSVLGVTGTSGKTTTCFLLEGALAACGVRAGLIGTVQSRMAGKVLPSALTTPEAPDLQSLFAVMAEHDVAAVAMEVSSHALALGRVSGTGFAVGAFLNLSQDHLDFHPDMEDYFAAKRMLFDGRAEREVVAVDDEWGGRLATARPQAVTVSGFGGPADVTVVHRQPLPEGRQQITVRLTGGRTVQGILGLPGAFNAQNAAVALAVLDCSGLHLDLDQAMAGLNEVVVPGRMERVQNGQDFLAVVDYAHKPAALAAVLEALAAGLAGRLIVVLGAGGDRDRGKRGPMGAQAAAWADLVIVTDDNPRSEDPAAIRRAVLDGARSGPARQRSGTAEVCDIGDRRAAIRAAVGQARPGDAVLIAGKGHELGQETAGVVQPFSDRDELHAALRQAAS